MSLLQHAARWLPHHEKTYRVSIYFPRPSMERLRAIKRLTDAVSDQAVIVKALMVYEELLDAYLSGDDVVIRRRDGTEQSVFDDSEPVSFNSRFGRYGTLLGAALLMVCIGSASASHAQNYGSQSTPPQWMHKAAQHRPVENAYGSVANSHQAPSDANAGYRVADPIHDCGDETRDKHGKACSGN